MRNSNFIICAAVAATAIVGIGAASAADIAPQMYTKAPVVVNAAYNWTGFYIGGNIGGGWGTRDVNYSPNDPASAALTTGVPIVPDSFKTSGVMGGLQLGYNYQFNRKWLIGLETDFDGTGMKGSGSTSYFGGSEFSSVQERIDWFGTVRARLGYLPTANLLAYFTGGFAYGNAARTATIATANGGASTSLGPGIGFACVSPPSILTVNGNPITSSTCFAGASRDIATGWTLGGGFEYAFSQRWTLKAEYLYVSLGSKSVTEIGSPIPGFTTSSLNANFGRTNFNVARVGLNYSFGGPVVAKY